MPLSGFSDYITPIEHFFVRTHVYAPRVDLSEWRLTVDGEVATPLTLTMDDLKRLPAVELVSVLECAGNGRGFYEPSMPGLQWANGGRRQRTLARREAGRRPQASRREGVSHEKSSSTVRMFRSARCRISSVRFRSRKRSMPDASRLRDERRDASRGARLPASRRGARLGRRLMDQVADVDFGSRQTSTTGSGWQRAYRHPGKPVAPGTAVPPEQMQPVTSLRVKSVIAAPLDGAHVVVGKPVTIRGVAWSGDAGPVTAVDVSVDGGRTWKPATLRRDQRTRFGWRQWEYSWTPPREAYLHDPGARAGRGRQHAAIRPGVESFRLWLERRTARGRERGDGAVRHRPRGCSPAPPASHSPTQFKNACLACHDEDVIRQQRLTRAQWDGEINKMIGWGAKVRDEDRRRAA